MELNYGTMVAAQNWSKSNPDGAQAWAAHLVDPPNNPQEGDTILSYVCFTIANFDPNRATVLREQRNSAFKGIPETGDGFAFIQPFVSSEIAKTSV